MKSLGSFPFIVYITFIPVLILHFPKYSQQSKIEFCLRGRHKLYADDEPPPSLELDTWVSDEDADVIQQVENEKSKILGCPSGILFNRPLQLEAVTSDEQPFCYKESICDEKWKCNIQRNSIVAEIIKIGKPSRNETWLYQEGDRKMKNSLDFGECQPTRHTLNYQKIDFNSNIRTKREITGLVPSEPTSADQIQREVDDQTKRMFYYLAGVNQDEVNSHLRIVKLFKMSSQLVSMICDPHYIKPKFLKEIERGFLFLLKEQGFDKMSDLDLESYNQLRQALEHCASTVKMINFMGRPCPSGIHVDKVLQVDTETGDIKSIIYSRGPKTFKWGEYDIVLDAAWSTMNIVHAGCFDSFSGKVNLLHKFEVALEQLFQSALYIRWEHPTQLTDDLFYDSMFMARVNDTMEAMDACTRILFLLTPFRSGMNRPIHETFYRRKKRSTSGESSEESNVKEFSSIENSIEASGRNGFASDTSLEELDYYEMHAPSFDCLKTEHERMSKVEMLQKREYDDCRGHPKRNS